ncbi:glycosyltransferase family A protein [Dyadobacter sp. 676]|uniref:Glycosyltransferase family A protein n=1 Tax=Dyadobacter sp. 676 TaxID=3088362 RepID=A0AAU8FQQ9_9BACT
MLNILIPTFNRSEFLLRNLEILSEIVTKGNFTDKISLVISDNCSTDNTYEEVVKFKARSVIDIDLYRQQTNIGLKDNVLFVLAKSTADYVMFLGDDDYINFDFLKECMDILTNNPDTTAIVPNCIPVSIHGEFVTGSRDVIGPSVKFSKGFDSVLQYSWKGHQMSGVVAKRRIAYEQYIKNGVDNIYPYIYFVSICGLQGSVFVIKNNPVYVTQPVQKKDWGYGPDGLINEIFDNYRKLPVSAVQRFKLEFRMLYIQNWRLLMYKREGFNAFLKAAFSIAFAKNASPLFTLSFPFILLLIKLRIKMDL